MGVPRKSLLGIHSGGESALEETCRIYVTLSITGIHTNGSAWEVMCRAQGIVARNIFQGKENSREGSAKEM
jgi:hypothetical protein